MYKIMKNKGRIYTADEGNFIVRKSDEKIMGENIDLGSADSIDNYEERPYTQEEYEDFCEKYGIKVPKDITNKVNNNN